MPDDLERDLLDRFVRGDQDAFEAIFRQFQVEVYRWILRIVRDPSAAEDALVDAFWRAYRGRAGFQPSRGFGAWMRRIATNAALDHLRRSRKAARLIAGGDAVAAPAGADRATIESIVRAFAALPPGLRVVATLAIVEERPYSEIADALDVPVGTVKSRVFRAVRILREELARQGIHP
ncbi:MAG: hypothetical protein A3H96_00960 [Acidobacteria bacterium RIFCSPLOWO2_02_FULL_67_36]|nr:MAG: hypothetical protein A3H96_00960 [Acidobacteria bacterium RIFCSPLOWO2_02_FULL_67_36]OFW23019.1 MAG: hypothetical protein A3G21_00390 [Acidobacteria bacterium RIFCSPLOWO2_12_FULL_66_21]